MKRIFCITVLMFLIHSITAQTVEEYFDLHFQSVPYKSTKWSWVQDALGCNFRIDSSLVYSNKYPLLIYPRYPELFYETSDSEELKTKMTFTLGKVIVLPPDSHTEDTLEISISCKTNTDSVKFQATALSSREETVHSDSLYIPSGKDWKNYAFKFTASGAQALKITVSYDRKRSGDEEIYIDKIRITSGKTDVNSLSVTALDRKPSLDSACIVSLENGGYSKIPGIENKKIIGLGVSSFGSQESNEIAYEFIKELVTDGKCKYIMFESLSMDMALLFDLYIRDSGFDDTDEIVDILKCSIGNYETTLSFFNFLREYNKTAGEKVKLFGIEIVDPATAITDNYFYRLLGADDCEYYLRNMKEGNYRKITDALSKDDKIKSILTDNDIAYLSYILEERTGASAMPFGDIYSKRNYYIFKNVSNIADIFFTDTDVGIIFAHSGQIGKTAADFRKNLPLGYYLNSRYRHHYFSITVQPGEGSYSEDLIMRGAGVFSNPLQAAPSYGLENVCLKTGLNCFFYPADRLPESVLTLRYIPRNHKNYLQSVFTYIPAHFDGFIFIRNSRPYDVCEDFSFYHLDSYLGRTAFKLNKLLEEKLK